MRQSKVSRNRAIHTSLQRGANEWLKEPVEGPCAKPQCPDLSGELSVIVPCFNEAKTLRELLERTRNALPNAQMIVVDDGSDDGSSEIAKDLGSSLGLVVYCRTCNGGKGAAVRDAIPHADRTYTVIQDADLEYQPSELCTLVRAAWEQDLDAVYGSRYKVGGRKPGGALVNYMAVRFLSWCVEKRWGGKTSDAATCYKLLRTDLLKSLNLKSNGFEICQEINVKLFQNSALKFLELPISYHPRGRSEGKKISYSDFFSALGVVARG